MFVGWKSRDSVPMLVDKFMKGQLKVAEFVTHTFPLDDINTAFDVMHQGKRYATLVVSACRGHVHYQCIFNNTVLCTLMRAYIFS